MGACPTAFDKMYRDELEDEGAEDDYYRACERANGEDVEAARLVLGDDVETTDDPEARRTAVHEAGHALTYLVEGIDFVYAEIDESGAGGHLSTVGLRDAGPKYPMPSPLARIAVEIGGAVAEQVVFANVDIWRACVDLHRAMVRARVSGTRVETATRHVLQMLTARKAALLALADALLSARRLTRVEAFRIVWGGEGDIVVPPPLFSPRSPLDELEQVRIVDAEIAERRARIEHLKGARA
jgi:hypothetical protein